MKRRAVLAVTCVLLLASWAGALLEGSFTSHMLAHVLAVTVAAPALAWAGRWPAWLAAPAAALVACGIEFVVVWCWHLPSMHALAAGNAAVFVIEQLTFLAAGVAVWAAVRPGSPSAGLLGGAVLLMTSMHMTLLGALLVLAPESLYHHAAQPRTLADQQLGGLVMLVACSTVYLAAALVVLGRMLRPDAAGGTGS